MVELQAPARARSIPCPRCGGIFPVADVTAAIDCPYCGHRFALTPAAVHELERYQRAVHAALGEANVQHQHSAAWSTTAQSMKTAWIALAVFGVLMGLLILSTIALQWGLTSGLVSQEIMPFFSLGSVIGVMGTTVTVSLWLSMRAKQSAQHAQAGSACVACPSCGAPNQLGSGQTQETCRYCRAALVPSQTLMLRAIDLSRAALRAAELNRYRAERTGMAAIMGRKTMTAAPYFVLGSFVPITGASTLIMTAQLLVGDADVPLAAVATMLALTSVNIGLIAAVYVWRKWNKQRFSTPLADLAHQFHGRLVSGLPDVVAWLNAYWASPYEISHLSVGPYHAAARLDAGGYAALVDVDPVAPAQQYQPRVHVLLAAAVPELAAGSGSPTVAAARHWLEQAGFTLIIQSSGLLARAHGKTLKRLRKSPESLHLLSTVITTLSGLAHGLRAERVEALP
jgi:DNA-directed RNA polymerase subunit RPC12/RpoP